MKLFAIAIFFVFGLFFIHGAWSTSEEQSHFPEYLKTEGTIIRSDTWSIMSDIYMSGNRYAPTVLYTYLVDGKTLTGHRISINEPRFIFERKARAYLKNAHYETGDKCAVFYDPSDPAHAYLDLDPYPNLWLFYAGGSICILFGLALLVVYFKYRNVTLTPEKRK